ncbi:hypothetical protein LQ327_24290 [Actinomycetospora endophytica]|uniref:Uncharacterized protein n=1 Tax=Actinomycetospora endophytica TaxID=2291215 RepID=A0ABS8PET9_9PSEU|nr:hypothetical protein [Actinomycetospora endophytica]MCD2196498.1 hypothetical protein [Actinomycetospora endophytica]
MIIDCDTCVVRHQACDDCVVGVLLGMPEVPGHAGPEADDAEAPREPAAPGAPLPVEFGPVERRALEVLADHGLIPHLRLVTAEPETAVDERVPAPRGPGRRRDAG